MDIVIATGNEGKLAEIQSILAHPQRNFMAQSHLAISSPPETGASFVENALLKARYAAEQSAQAALSDDSGIVVPDLKGAPGIYSARYAGENATDEDNMQKLLSELEKHPNSAREAYYYCSIVFIRHPEDPIPIICQARWEGVITAAPRGDEGFGYDPCFWLASHNCTVAQLDASEKNQISHRAQALRQLSDLLLFEGI